MKRTLSILIAFVMVLSCFVACSKAGDEEIPTTTQPLTTAVTEVTTAPTTTDPTTEGTTISPSEATSTTKKKTTTTKKKTTTTKIDYSKQMGMTVSSKGKEIIKQVGGMSFNDVMDDLSCFTQIKKLDVNTNGLTKKTKKIDDFYTDVEYYKGKELVFVEHLGSDSYTYFSKTKSGLKSEILISKNGDDTVDAFVKTSKYSARFYSVKKNSKLSYRAMDVTVENKKNDPYILSVMYSNSEGKTLIEKGYYMSKGKYKEYNSFLQDGKLIEYETVIDNPLTTTIDEIEDQ